MSIGDIVYGNIIKDIRLNGAWDSDATVRTMWKDGKPAHTKSIINAQMKFDNSTEYLDSMLTQKRVPQRDPINEMFWIWKYKSNDVNFLENHFGCKVWSDWKRHDGSIGKAYGWQLANKHRVVPADSRLRDLHMSGKINRFIPIFESEDSTVWNYARLDQVDYLIYQLTYNPHSRRIKTSLWGTEDLDDMALEPCVYETHWQLWDGRLHLTVNIRSNDMGLGNPYNTYQYSILHRLIAQVTGHKAGTICFNIDNAHIYDRHMDILLEQIKAPMHDVPIVWINPDIESFYDFTADDIKLIDYKCEKSRRMEIAI
jgi:thymidylate synthase